MSKVPYTVNVDEYICSALEEIRKMDKTRDYSSLMAVVERIQHHGSSMEEALYQGKDFKNAINRAYNENSSKKKFKEEIKKILDRYK